MKKNNLIGWLFIIVIFTIILIYISSINIINNNFDNRVYLSSIVIIIIALTQLLMDNKKYSLNKIFWLFNLFFLGIAPIINYISEYFPWKYSINNEKLFTSNLYIILIFFVYIISSMVINSKQDKNISKIKGILFDDKLNKKNIQVVLLIVSCICFMILSLNIGFSNLFIRTKNYTDIVEDSSLNSIITTFCRAFPVFSFSILYYLDKKVNVKINKVIYCLTLLILIIVNFPTSVTRFWMGAIYIGVFCIVFERKLRYRTFDIAVIVILLFVFPVFVNFKRTTLSEFEVSKILKYDLVAAYNTTDFDAYTLIPRSFEFLEEYGSTHGNQILTTILFFIPRSIWKSKSVATGALIAIKQGQWYTNISCPYIAEGLVNFGFIGGIFFTIIIARIIKYLDNTYWKIKEIEDDKNVYLIELYYPFLLGFFLFMLRGALHHAIVYTCGFLLPIIVIYLINKIKVVKYERKN